MPRPLSAPAIDALLAQSTGQAFVLLVTFTHAVETFRCCMNTEMITSRGQQFTPTFFQFRLPETSDKAPQGCEISVDNVDQRMVDILRRITTPIKVLIELVLASQPDVVELAIGDLVLREVSWNIHQISGKLMVEDMLNSAFPGHIYEPRTFQGIF